MTQPEFLGGRKFDFVKSQWNMLVFAVVLSCSKVLKRGNCLFADFLGCVGVEERKRQRLFCSFVDFRTRGGRRNEGMEGERCRFSLHFGA
jgi:hypothetical protein